MIVDTSALVSIALAEPCAKAVLAELTSRSKRFISAVSLLEAGIVMRGRHGQQGVRELRALVASLKLEVVPFDEAQAERAIHAFSRFGKGMGHRAQLNFGDCAVYALAFTTGKPILAIGNDFAQTDVPVIDLLNSGSFIP